VGGTLLGGKQFFPDRGGRLRKRLVHQGKSHAVCGNALGKGLKGSRKIFAAVYENLLLAITEG